MPPKKIVKKEISNKTGNTRITYSDGSVEIIKAGEAPKQSSGEKNPYAGKKYNPYGDNPLTEQLIKQYGVKADAELYKNPIGYQKKSGKGYGEDIDVQQWKENNPVFNTQFEKKYGRPFDPNSVEDIKEFESFHTRNTFKTLSDRIAKMNPNLSPEEVAENAYTITKDLSFRDDTSVRGKDQKWGNYHRSRRELEFFDLPNQQKEQPGFEVGAKAKGQEAVTQQDLYNPMVGQPYDFPDEPFIQDIIKTAAARKNYYSIPDEMAWNAKATPHLMDYVLRSPERALAANSEGYNIGAQQLGTFGGRAALSSQLSQLSGKHAANAADILAQVEGQNVATTNQAYGVNADILNRFGMYDAENATSQYYDQLNMNRAKQSAKNKAWNEWTDAVVNTIDNQAKAYNINTLNPEYGIYGSTGGKIYRTPYDRGMKPSQGQDDAAMAKRYNELKKMLPDAKEETIMLMMGIGK